jgi:hypothetical protein
MGSGTTGVACQQLSRSFIGYELSEDFFRMAEKLCPACFRAYKLKPKKTRAWSGELHANIAPRRSRIRKAISLNIFTNKD